MICFYISAERGNNRYTFCSVPLHAPLTLFLDVYLPHRGEWRVRGWEGGTEGGKERRREGRKDG